MLTLPLAEACWDTWKLLLLALLPVPIPLELLPDSCSASIRFRFPRDERVNEELLLEVARETVIREGGVGVSFNLKWKRG